MNARSGLILASIFGFLGVLIGAFGAHGLKNILDARQLTILDTAVRYQFLHALALVGISFPRINKHSGWLKWSRIFFVVGILLFSGSLYVMIFAQIQQVAFITPFGGMCMLAGWVCLLMFALKIKSE